MDKLIVLVSLFFGLQGCTSLNSRLESFDVVGFEAKIVLHAELNQHGNLKVLLHETIPANTVLEKNSEGFYNLSPYVVENTRILLIKNDKIILDSTFTALRKEFKVSPLERGDQVVIRVEAAGFEAVYSETEIFPESIQFTAENVDLTEFNEIFLDLIDISNILETDEAFVYFDWEYSYFQDGLLVSEQQNALLGDDSCKEREGYYYQCLKSNKPLSVSDQLIVFLGINEESMLRNLQLVVYSVNKSFFKQYENFQFFLSDLDPAFEDPVLGTSNLSNNYGSFALKNIQTIRLK